MKSEAMTYWWRKSPLAGAPPRPHAKLDASNPDLQRRLRSPDQHQQNLNSLLCASPVTAPGPFHAQKDAAAHCLAVYDAMTLRNEEQLDGYFQIGTLLLQIESFCGGDKKRMGEKITSLGLDVISAPDRSDPRSITTNWQAVQKMRKDGSLDGLGVSAIRKRLRKAIQIGSICE